MPVMSLRRHLKTVRLIAREPSAVRVFCGARERSFFMFLFVCREDFLLFIFWTVIDLVSHSFIPRPGRVITQSYALWGSIDVL